MAEKKEKVTLSPEELLKQKEVELTAKEAELNTREKDLADKESDILSKQEELDTLSVEYQKKDELYAASQSELKKLQAEIKKLKNPGKVDKPIPGKEFELEDVKYKFKNSTPKNIRIDGVVLSQDEIVEDEDVLLQLVGGNSGLIEKIND